jgi:cell division protein FtsB
MKIASILITILIIVALAGETVFIFHQFSTQQALMSQQLQLQQKIGGLEKEKLSLEKDNANLEKVIEQLNKENDTLTERTSSLEEENKKLADQVADLTKTGNVKTSDINRLQSEVSTINKKLLCENLLTKVDFTNNETVNKSLVSYVEANKNEVEPVSAHYWNLIWTGSKYSVHTIEVHSAKDQINYIWKFTVYFQGESYGDHVNGVFYNDDQCWLYMGS